MIANEVQHRTTQTQLKHLEEARQSLLAQPSEGGDGQRRALELAALDSQASDLRQELHDYEQLRSGAVRELRADSLAEFPHLLIRARIARGWSQRDLAERLGVAEQQIQRMLPAFADARTRQ